jgi:hypothetical protein
MGGLVIGFCAMLAVVALAAEAPAAKHKVFFASNCTNSKYKPHHLIAACGDAGLVVNGIAWSTYGTKTALGDGTAVTNTCKPDCAAGHFRDDPASVKLYRPRFCQNVGLFHFTRLLVTYTNGKPPGANQSITFPFPCSALNTPSG